MTKFLSDCLEATEPFFRQGLSRLEASNGHPRADIRVSVEVEQAARRKMQELGLDPADTTPKELYFVLLERLKQDDAKLVKVLRGKAAYHVSAEGQIVDGIAHCLKEVPDSMRGFAIKPASFKTLIKQIPPKKAMKNLGYRSLESFLKKESAPAILAAAKLYEGEHWHKRLLESYRKLKPSDFEDRTIEVVTFAGARWRHLSKEFVDEFKHNILSLRELGALALLPLPHDAPAGTATACLGLALHELNEIRASGTYLKLCQVRSDFGRHVQVVVAEQPRLESNMLDISIPWQLVQRYYSRLKEFGTSFFEPHLQVEDIAWHPIEASLKAIEPAFAFWSGSGHVAVLHGRKPVSFNLIDAALNCCNQIPFETRLAHYLQDTLWHELLLRYLKPEAVEETLMRQMQPRLAAEMAAA